MSGHLSWIPGELERLSNDGLLRTRREVRPRPGRRCIVDGRDVWDFASNDYLGLAADPRVIAAAAEALPTHGVGAKASPLVAGRTDLHVALERALCEFEGTDAAILFPTGMAANIGTVSALATADDVVFCDRLNHASLVDGCRASGAKLRVYRHDDLSNLNDSLTRESSQRKYIVTDSVFSMDGDLAPLSELCEIAERHGAALIVDEAHATGVFGKVGRGVAELQGVEEQIAVRIGTLSKAIGTLGGFVTGSQALIDYLWNKARTQVYSTALPPCVCAAATAAIRIIQDEPWRRARLHAISASFRNQLQTSGVSICAGSVGPIVPIILHDPQAAVIVADRLLKEGYLVGAIRPPTVPRGSSRLRITLSCDLPDEVVAQFASKISEFISIPESTADHRNEMPVGQ